MYKQNQMKQKIECSYSISNWCLRTPKYCCEIRNKIINSYLELEFIGDHFPNRSNSDVDAITFQGCYVDRLPQGIIKIFPNLKYFEFSRSNLNYIDREDLKEFENVTDLYLQKNKIVYLPNDLFADLSNLEVIWLHDNNFQLIEPNVFNNLNNLINLQLPESYVFNTYKASPRDTTLIDIKNELRAKYEVSPWKHVFQARRKNDLYNDLQQVMKSEGLKDFTIRIEEEEFKAHKFVLAARSQVFAELFENNKDLESFNLIDIKPKIFRIIFNFIYTNQLFEMEDEILFQVVLISKKLKIDKLTKNCIERLILKVNANNAFKMLEFSNKYKFKDLKQKSFEEIKKILGTQRIDESFANQPEKLKKLLEMKIKMDEIEIEFNALLLEN
ncbi:hypothetical protein PVAND_000919 [Polypedilum vanderplanki]|uniref:BTB domain-containing protein n=1 Tax=Polypedilum vanderplanki TaxID=319348 RepID=A0A9J6BLZ5_POLVA|nr:hypothetical protein PVAND_000919 [Polypedilum vanderplanki]